jgi:hypothetical protein
MLDPKPLRSTVTEGYDCVVKITGINGANPTNVIAPGCTVTRTGEGAYLITWGESPGTYKGLKGFGFEATTPADLAGYTVVTGVYNATAKTLAFVVYNSSFAAADLIAAQSLTLNLGFSFSSLTV